LVCSVRSFLLCLWIFRRASSCALRGSSKSETKFKYPGFPFFRFAFPLLSRSVYRTQILCRGTSARSQVIGRSIFPFGLWRSPKGQTPRRSPLPPRASSMPVPFCGVPFYGGKIFPDLSFFFGFVWQRRFPACVRIGG